MSAEESQNINNQSGSKIKKAAAMLMALGSQNAARVLRHLEPHEAERLMREILKQGKPDEQSRREALLDLQRELRRLEETTSGGYEQARSLLVAALGEKKATEVLERLELRDLSHKFHELEEYSPEQMAQVLSGESEQTAAVVLSQLHPPYAAQVLNQLPKERKAEIARRIAYLKKVHPQALKAAAENLRRKLEQIQQETPLQEPNGENVLTQILKHMPPESEQAIFEALEQDEPEIAERLKAKLFVFEDLLEVDKEGIRRLFEAVPDQGVWARALKGAGTTLRRHILSNISLNRASDITEEMKRIGAIPLREVEYERRVILRAAEKLRSKGEIFLARDRDDLVS